jgi:hypothetical protein
MQTSLEETARYAGAQHDNRALVTRGRFQPIKLPHALQRLLRLVS